MQKEINHLNVSQKHNILTPFSSFLFDVSYSVSLSISSVALKGPFRSWLINILSQDILVSLKYFYRPINRITCHNLLNSYLKYTKLYCLHRYFFKSAYFLGYKTNTQSF